MQDLNRNNVSQTSSTPESTQAPSYCFLITDVQSERYFE